MKLEEKTLKENCIYNGKILRVFNDEVECGDGHISKREYVDHHGGASILAVDDDENIYLVEQYRYAYRKVLKEIPAGKLEQNEDPMVCAKRELKEEVGVTCKEMQLLALIYPTPGYTNEPLYIYLAKGLEQGEDHLDEGELLKAYKIPFDEALRQVESGEIKDGKTVVAILKYALMRQSK